MNYFLFYQLPVSFNPNIQKVKQQYLENSKKYHPDFFATATDAEKEHALEMSALNNAAYKTLTNPMKTIGYVLDLNNMLQEDEKYELPKDFLMEMLELNEAVSDAKIEDDENKIEATKQVIYNLQSTSYNLISNLITAETIEEIDNRDLLQVKEYYFKKKYLQRILDSIN